jgi:hypothetical protein
MRTNTKQIGLLVLAASISTFFSADVAGQGAVTAAAAITLAQSQLSDLVDHASDDVKAVAGSMAVQINQILDHLKSILGDEINKPITELTSTAANQLTAAQALVAELQKTISGMSQCLGNQGDIALSTFKGGLQNAVTSLPLTKSDPIAYIVEDPTARSPYVIIPKAGVRTHVILRGANLWAKADICSDAATVQPLSHPGPAMSVDLVNSDHEKVDLLLPIAMSEGEWLLTVSAKH